MTVRHLLFTLAFFLLAPAGLAAAASQAEILHQAGDWRVYGDGPPHLDVGLGVFDLDEEASAAARVEWRGGKKAAFVGPAVGLLANTDGGAFGYAGLYADISYRRLILTPFWGAVAYEEGDGSDLGGTFQFRSAITLAYRIDDRSRLGLHFAHVSNADLHEENPGEQDLFLTFARSY